ncbi:unnamed protein product [Closterium sp. NIES-54]
MGSSRMDHGGTGGAGGAGPGGALTQGTGVAGAGGARGAGPGDPSAGGTGAGDPGAGGTSVGGAEARGAGAGGAGASRPGGGGDTARAGDGLRGSKGSRHQGPHPWCARGRPWCNAGAIVGETRRSEKRRAATPRRKEGRAGQARAGGEAEIWEDQKQGGGSACLEGVAGTGDQGGGATGDSGATRWDTSRGLLLDLTRTPELTQLPEEAL